GPAKAQGSRSQQSHLVLGHPLVPTLRQRTRFLGSMPDGRLDFSLARDVLCARPGSGEGSSGRGVREVCRECNASVGHQRVDFDRGVVALDKTGLTKTALMAGQAAPRAIAISRLGNVSPIVGMSGAAGERLAEDPGPSQRAW